VALKRVNELHSINKFNKISGDNAREIIYWNWKSSCYFRFPFTHARQASDMTYKHPSDSHIPEE
jgi:hypothetical protein